MKFVRLLSIFFLLSLCGTSYALKQEFVFIGQNGDEAAFALEVMGDISKDQNIQISEDGEVYIKVEKIIAVPKEVFSAMKNSQNQFSSCSTQYQGLCNQELRSYGLEDEVTECGSRVTDTSKKWQCPYCYLWYDLGERCDNEDCPTKQWEKNKDKDRDKNRHKK